MACRDEATGKDATVPTPETPTARSRVQEASPANLYGLLAEAVGRWPDKVAIGTAGRQVEISYGDLDVAVRRLAARLEGLGLRPEADIMALCCDNSMEFVVTLLAAASLGVAVAPLDPTLPPAVLASRAAAVHARAFVLAAHLYDPLIATELADHCPAWLVAMSGPGGQAAVTVPSDSPALSAPAGNAVARDTALLLSTTGSTSTPKVVPLSAGNVAAAVRGIQATYQLGPQDTTLLIMPLYHGHGLIAGLLATLASGGAAYLPAAGRFSASTFWSEMSGIGATWYTAVPTIHQILLRRAATEYPQADPPPLRFIRSCSAPLAPAILHQLETAFSAPVVQAYGMTETSHQAASNPLPAAGQVKAGSVGLPTGVELRIVRPDGQPVPPGTPGEIWISGPAVARGYLDDPQTTARSFAAGWFHTGDLGYQDQDGYLFLTGRSKELINRGGEKFAPQQIDAVLLSSAKVQDALSFGVPDEKYGEEIYAAVILKPGQQADEQELEAYCRLHLGAAGSPKRIFFVSEFPLTSKNVGDRRKLAAQFSPPLL